MARKRPNAEPTCKVLVKNVCYERAIQHAIHVVTDAANILMTDKIFVRHINN